VADTFDALTSSRAYHTPRRVADALRILKDSADYDLDPTAVEAMLTWIANIGKQLGKASEELTVEDLLAARSESEAEPVSCPTPAGAPSA
jgi:HD-GYP domain-containing protein (c-di-GMP phosphodiesterase class II)